MSGADTWALAEPCEPVQVGQQQRWNESLYGWWYDSVAGIAGVHRIAHLPNDGAGTAQIWQGILTHDGRRFRHCEEVRFDRSLRQDGAYQVEGLEVRLPLGGMEVRYESSECSTEIRFTDLHPPVDWAAMRAGHSKDASELLFSGHVEAGCAVSGTVSLMGEIAEVDALGFRAHSWGGQRDMRPLRSTRWANGTIGPACTFGVLYAALSTGEIYDGGFVIRDGEFTALEGFDLVVDVESDGISWRAADLVLRCSDGSEVEVAYGPAFDGIVLQSREWLECESAMTIQVDGVEGAGNIEVSTNARGGLEMPRSITGACARDGFSRRTTATPHR